MNNNKLKEVRTDELQQPLQPSVIKRPGKLFYIFKRIFDILISFFGMIFLSPVFLGIAIAIKLDDGGKVFYVHNRVGLNGKKVGVFKYRSMMENADKIENMLTPKQLEEYLKEYKIDNDPRITRVGNFLRKSSLDELPQLLNIFLGQLSVVGPRPVMEDELEHYGNKVDKLLSVKPGLTGYWQAYARNNVTYESGERQRMELYYVDNQSLWFDIKIFFKTFVSVLKRDGAQ